MDKIPRKLKKKMLGKKMKRKHLLKLLSSVKVIEHKLPYSNEILPFEFCPKCGCQRYSYYNHHVGYPEVWIECFCLRCGHIVGTADNSPYVHCLEDMVN